MLMIQRDRTGRFVDFRSPDTPKVTEFQGRFARIMPPKPPGEKERRHGTATPRDDGGRAGESRVQLDVELNAADGSDFARTSQSQKSSPYEGVVFGKIDRAAP
jgi:hypothetical protein